MIVYWWKSWAYPPEICYFPVESASAGLLIKHHFLCGEPWEFCWGFMGSAELIEPIIFTNMWHRSPFFFHISIVLTIIPFSFCHGPWWNPVGFGPGRPCFQILGLSTHGTCSINCKRLVHPFDEWQLGWAKGLEFLTLLIPVTIRLQTS